MNVCRPVTVGAGERVIATRPLWVLSVRPDKGAKGWQSIRLYRMTAAPKVSYWIGFNGVRMARTKDWGILVRNDPDVADWVSRELAEWWGPF